MLGNEGSGLDPRIEPTDRVYYPDARGIESLNVRVAGSILLYEASAAKETDTGSEPALSSSAPP